MKNFLRNINILIKCNQGKINVLRKKILSINYYLELVCLKTFPEPLCLYCLAILLEYKYGLIFLPPPFSMKRWNISII